MSKTKKLWLILTLAGFLLSSPLIIVQAQQGTGEVIIQQVDTSQFPAVSFYMEVLDENQQPIADIKPADILVLEDGQPPVTANRLETVEPGIQFILAYNLNNSFVTTVNEAGENAYQVITNRLISWLNSLPENIPDDFSLTSKKGLQSIRQLDPAEFADSISSYEPDFTQAPVGSASLVQSLDLATDPNPNPLMKRSILYVTALPSVSELSSFEGIINRAVQQGVQVNIWLVAPASTPENNSALYEPLVELTQKTNGSLFLYSGQEDFPNPEAYLSSRRTIYQVFYNSVINYKGNHTLSVQVQNEREVLTSTPYRVSIDVLPPNLIVLNPPMTISREWVEDDTSGELTLTPANIDFNFIIEFPDSYPRTITSVKLWVNGTLKNEIISPPFESISLDLSDLDISQEINVQIEAQDVLDLKTNSAPLLISIENAEKPLTFWQSILQLSPQRWIILLSVLSTATVLVLTIFLIGKRNNFWRNKTETRKRYKDPVTQPVPIRQDRPSQPLKRQYPKFNGNGTNAWLVPLDENFIAIREKAVPLQQQELKIGRDQKQATLVLNSKAIENVHATITRNKDGDYWIADNRTAAGTWVNYVPVTYQGIPLSHGDLIHFGKFSYQFERQTLEENKKN
jgi:hypothetical protein